MSKRMLTSFFPAHCSLIFEPLIPRVYELLYPRDVEETCPESVLTDVLGLGISVRQPFLALFALMGMYIGLLGALRLQSRLTTRGHSTAPGADMLHNPEFYWMLTFLFFGLMNFNGLFLHCLLPTTEISPLERPFLWVGDTFTTGAFGSALWAAAIMESLPTLDIGLQKTKTIYDWIPLAWAFANMLGVGAIAWFLVFGYDADGVIPGTLFLELWYAAPTAVYGSSALFLMLFRKFSWWLCLGIGTSYMTFILALFDAFLCRKLKGAFLDLFTTPTLFFLATDFVYVGIAIWLEQQHQEMGRKEKQV